MFNCLRGLVEGKGGKVLSLQSTRWRPQSGIRTGQMLLHSVFEVHLSVDSCVLLLLLVCQRYTDRACAGFSIRPPLYLHKDLGYWKDCWLCCIEIYTDQKNEDRTVWKSALTCQ